MTNFKAPWYAGDFHFSLVGCERCPWLHCEHYGQHATDRRRYLRCPVTEPRIDIWAPR